jgi:hypothetical protein
MTPTSSQISERRKLVAIGIKAEKSQRLIARELNVTETTIRRDMDVLGITANKKPSATIRKPAVAFKVASQHPAKPLQPAPNPSKRFKLPPRPVFPRRVVPEPIKPKPPKPLSPKQQRRQHLEEMLQLVGTWLLEQRPNYLRAINVLDKARIRLATHRDVPARASESTMSAVQLRDHTRPPEMDATIPQGTYRTEEICALWLARWLAAWEPKDEQLRYQVLDQTRARVTT